VIAASGVAEVCVDDRVDAIAELDRLAQDGPMRKNSLHRLGTAAHVGDDGVVIVGVEPASISDLAAGVGVEAGAVENNLNRVAGIGGWHALAVLHDGQDFCAIDA
jgi:hypothetical protein